MLVKPVFLGYRRVIGSLVAGVAVFDGGKPIVGVALKALTALSAITWASLPESRIVFRADSESTMTAVTARLSEASVVNRASTWAEKQESLDVE